MRFFKRYDSLHHDVVVWMREGNKATTDNALPYMIGFRCSTKVVQINGVTPEMTLERLRQYNLTDGIRTKEEVNKEAALGWPDERLELVGLRRRTADAFFIEIKKDSVPDGGSSGAAVLERAS